MASCPQQAGIRQPRLEAFFRGCRLTHAAHDRNTFGMKLRMQSADCCLQCCNALFLRKTAASKLRPTNEAILPPTSSLQPSLQRTPSRWRDMLDQRRCRYGSLVKLTSQHLSFPDPASGEMHLCWAWRSLSPQSTASTWANSSSSSTKPGCLWLSQTWGSDYLQFSGLDSFVRGSNPLNCRLLGPHEACGLLFQAR